MRAKGRLIAPLTVALAAVLAAGVASAQPGGAGDKKDRETDQWNRPARMTAGKPRLGVRLLEISGELRAYFGAPADRGVLVDSVMPATPAFKAGFRAGDVILVVDGDSAAASRDVLSALSDRKKGETVAIDIVRDKKHMTLRVTLEDDPGPLAGLDLDRRLGPGFRMGGEETQRRLEDIEKRLEQLEQAK